MKLVYTDNSANNGLLVQVGHHVVIDSTIYEVTYFAEPHKSSSSGKVSVRPAYDIDAMSREYYVGVIDAEWIEREDQGYIEEEDHVVTKLDDIKIGDTLKNGAVVLAIDNDIDIVMALRSGTVEPFVIWGIMKDGSCHSGHYFSDIIEVSKEYERVISNKL